MSMEYATGAFSSIKLQDYVDFSIKAGFPKEVSKQFLGLKVTTTLEPVKGKSKTWNIAIECREMPQLGFEDIFEDGVEVERDVVYLGGKTKMLYTMVGDNTFKVKCQNDILGTLFIEEVFTPEGVYAKLTHPGSSSTLNEFLFREGKPKDMSCTQGLYARIKDQEDVDFAIKAGFPEEVAKTFLGVKIITGVEEVGGHPIRRRYTIESPDMPQLNFEGTYEENIEHDLDMAYFGGKTKALIQSTGSNRFVARYKNNTIGTLVMDEVYAPNGVFVKVIHKDSGATLDEIWKRI
ncbi:hypothetical protein TCAL_07447 [Tigriopus californicus]|uniref:Uncharacterized protein n=1 Tax=Tigriopus californicus TaxID=6832 RepID=A0A553N7B9_TIGCA|nr:uncharacterized protein LOC131885029 [Tigriopus californicus]TRY61338.1 hypothetical protein TCAL_07447 [Tigriopus californicus]|eukprot:TCALIF_07447-PA protein Name:"Protein of unknown function" AED:0.06 eAED:0.06 QI:55/1/0.5/1/1/1/2/0/291